MSARVSRGDAHRALETESASGLWNPCARSPTGSLPGPARLGGQVPQRGCRAAVTGRGLAPVTAPRGRGGHRIMGVGGLIGADRDDEVQITRLPLRFEYRHVWMGTPLGSPSLGGGNLSRPVWRLNAVSLVSALNTTSGRFLPVSPDNRALVRGVRNRSRHRRGRRCPAWPPWLRPVRLSREPPGEVHLRNRFAVADPRSRPEAALIAVARPASTVPHSAPAAGNSGVGRVRVARSDRSHVSPDIPRCPANGTTGGVILRDCVSGWCCRSARPTHEPARTPPGRRSRRRQDLLRC